MSIQVLCPFLDWIIIIIIILLLHCIVSYILDINFLSDILFLNIFSHFFFLFLFFFKFSPILKLPFHWSIVSLDVQVVLKKTNSLIPLVAIRAPI